MASPERGLSAYVEPARSRSGLWRTALGLLLIFGLYMGVTAGLVHLAAHVFGRSAVLSEIGGTHPGSTPGGALIVLASFIPLVLLVFAITAALHRRGPGTLLGRDWPLGFLRAALTLALLHLVLLWLGSFLPGPPLEPGLSPLSWLIFLPLAVPLIAIQTLAEELIFRAYLIQQLGARSRWRLVWLVLPACVFGALHADPSSYGNAWIIPVISAVCFGLIAGDLTARHASIGPSWGLHFVNNCAAILLVAPEGPLSGLSLWHTPFDPASMLHDPLVFGGELLPLLLAWLVLRRGSGT